MSQPERDEYRSSFPPPTEGGQGREGGDLEEGMVAFTWCALAIVILILVAISFGCKAALL